MKIILLFLVFYLCTSFLIKGTTYCYVTDLPHNFMLDAIREHYASHPDEIRPMEDTSIIYAMKYFLWSIARPDRFSNFEIMECAITDGNDTVFIGLPNSAEELYEMAYELGFHTPYMIYEAAKNETYRRYYCDTDNAITWRDTIIRYVWCKLYPWYASISISIPILQTAVSTPAETSLVMEEGESILFINGAREAARSAREFVASAPSNYPALVQKWDRMVSQFSHVRRVLSPKKTMPAIIRDTVHNLRKITSVSALMDVRTSIPYLRRANQMRVEHLERMNESCANPADETLERFRDVKVAPQPPRRRFGFFVIGVPIYEGMAPGQNHVWNLEHWPSTAVIVAELFNWLFNVNRDETQCRPRFPWLASSEYSCVWPIIFLDEEIFIERWFPGWDLENPGCDEYNWFVPYFLGLFRALFLMPLPPNLIPCLIWNIYIPLFWLFVFAWVIMFLVILVIAFCISWGWLNNFLYEETKKQEEIEGKVMMKTDIKKLSADMGPILWRLRNLEKAVSSTKKTPQSIQSRALVWSDQSTDRSRY